MLKKIYWTIVIISVITLISYGFYSDYKAKQQFCELSFSGKITEIKISVRELYDIKIENDRWYFLGMFVLYQVVPIEVGDTIVKEKACYKVTLIKKGKQYNIGNDWKTPCDCESKSK